MFELGQVVGIHPEANSVDLVLIKGGVRLTGVQVMSGAASGNTGMTDLAMPDLAGTSDPFESGWSNTRDMIAIVGYVGHVPLVFGFLFPQVSQMLFADRERMVYRHASDVYVTIDKDGNTEISHPGGAYFRIGTSSDHEDLTGKDFDKKWKISRNKGKKTHVHLEIPGAVSFNFSPDGAVTLDCSSTVDVTAGGAVTVKAPSVTLDAPMTHCTGQLVVDGLITGKGGLAISGGNGATVDGNIESTGDQIAGGISTMNHTHTEQGDGAEVSPPH